MAETIVEIRAEQKKKLLDRYTNSIDVLGRNCAETLNTLQDVARDFGWEDVLADMQRQAREKL